MLLRNDSLGIKWIMNVQFARLGSMCKCRGFFYPSVNWFRSHNLFVKLKDTYPELLKFNFDCVCLKFSLQLSSTSPYSSTFFAVIKKSPSQFYIFLLSAFGRNKLYLKMRKVNQKPEFINLNFNCVTYMICILKVTYFFNRSIYLNINALGFGKRNFTNLYFHQGIFSK